jgi:hypothetical protein
MERPPRPLAWSAIAGARSHLSTPHESTSPTQSRFTGHASPVSRMVLGWGLAVGVATAAAPLAFWWLPATSVYSTGLVLIAAVYIGFAVADGRPHVLIVESLVATAFVIVAAVAMTGPAWLVVAGLFGHGAKDLWQHRTGFVNGTRWWPPFCVTVDWVAAVLLAAILTAGVPLP